MKEEKPPGSDTSGDEAGAVTPRGETLANYITKVRKMRGYSKAELARRSRLHFSSLSRIENGETEGKKMRLTVQSNLATALKIPVEYIRSACRGEEVDTEQTNNVCPSCWIAGTSPDVRWSMADARFCLRCGSRLRNRCDGCNEPILLTAKFCPECGTAYRESSVTQFRAPGSR
jgi:transcriptional regulator with XRE-family HTH domain